MYHKLAVMSLLMIVIIPDNSWFSLLVSFSSTYLFLYGLYYVFRFVFGDLSIGSDDNKKDDTRQIGKMRRKFRRNKKLRRK